MGMWIAFSCAACGYTAEVSGGPDAGMLVDTQTMTCLDCRELIDVVTGSRSPDTDPEIGRCPDCQGSRLEPWGREKDPLSSFTDVDLGNNPGEPDPPRDGWGPCPKCGSPMSAGDVVAVWD